LGARALPDQILATKAFLRSTNQYNNRELIGCELAEQEAPNG